MALALAAGFVIGRMTASDGTADTAGTTGSCAQVTKERAALADQIKAALVQQFRTGNVSTQLALQSKAGPDLVTAAHITVNNPSCFTPADVAENQKVLALAER
ncbi:hypothetical protein ACIRST_35460 [Kitasatospora sp. NPDC101447]|uniref:hypothetical protein n=1 Tax=Kitasatospora sp. NPDC101447 TaxID=3364102 RepID=UPI00380D2EFA